MSIGADVAQDIAGNGNGVSDDYALTIDSMAPSVIITTSTPQTVNTESFTLTGTAEAGSVVDVLKDGSSIGTLTATSTAWTFPVMLNEGVNTFMATATDSAGNTSEQPKPLSSRWTVLHRPYSSHLLLAVMVAQQTPAL